MKQQILEGIIENSKFIKREKGIKYIKVSKTIYSIIGVIDNILDCMAHQKRPRSKKYRVIPNDYQVIN